MTDSDSGSGSGSGSGHLSLKRMPNLNNNVDVTLQHRALIPYMYFTEYQLEIFRWKRSNHSQWSCSLFTTNSNYFGLHGPFVIVYASSNSGQSFDYHVFQIATKKFQHQPRRYRHTEGSDR